MQIYLSNRAGETESRTREGLNIPAHRVGVCSVLRDQERAGCPRVRVGGQLLLDSSDGVAGPHLAHGCGVDVGAHREGIIVAGAEPAHGVGDVGLAAGAHVPDRARDAVGPGPAVGVAERVASLLERC